MPALESPDYAIIGATNPVATCTFLKRFDFEEQGRVHFSPAAARHLYGLDGASEGVMLQAPGARRGRLQVTATPMAAPPSGSTDQGAHAIDLYTRDIEKSLGIAEAAGGRVSSVSRYQVGPLTLQEAKAEGPDALQLVFLQVDRRRSSRLDTMESALHSELHSFVWVVGHIDLSLPFWRDEAGLQVFLDVTMREPAIARFMGLPRADAPLRLAMMADAAGLPARLELIEFPEDPGAVLPSWPLRGGLFAPGFLAASLESATQGLTSARFGEAVEVVENGKRGLAVSGLAPGGVRFEVRQA